MIKILTDDIELLKEVCESLAYDLIMECDSDFRYDVSDNEMADCL